MVEVAANLLLSPHADQVRGETSVEPAFIGLCLK